MTYEADRRVRREARAALRLQYAAETRQFEIGLFWQRSLFFWTIIGSAFVAYGVLEDKSDHAQLLVSCFGIACSFGWYLQNRGAKYWHDAWEEKTHRLQHDALDMNLFQLKEEVRKTGLFGAARYSATRVVIILSAFSTVIWLSLGARSMANVWPSPYPLNGCWSEIARMLREWAFLGIVGVTLTFCVLLAVKGRSRE